MPASKVDITEFRKRKAPFVRKVSIDPARRKLWLYRFSRPQIAKLADYTTDLAQVSVATVFLPYAIDDPRPLTAIWGIVFATFFWITGLYLTNKQHGI